MKGLINNHYILLVYGEGGHKSEMKKLYNILELSNKTNNLIFIGLSENFNTIDELEHNYSLPPLRDKHSVIKDIINFPKKIYKYFKVLQSIKQYNPQAVISSGPGIAIPISLYFKFYGKKIIFIEDWCRFDTKSITGRLMYRIADKFYIQNESLKKYYPNGIYGGLL